MFSIYGLSGPIFSGTLEDLSRVRALAKIRAVQAVTKIGDEVSVGTIARPASLPHEEAVRAYRAMLPPDLERGPLYHAEQIMQRQVISVAASNDVAQAWRTLRDHRIHQAPVLADKARLVGIVSERDLLTAINIDGDRIVESLGRHVSDVMTTPVVAAAPVTDIRRIAAVMLESGVDGVPIIGEGGELVGIVSRGDILRTVVTDPPLSLWR